MENKYFLLDTHVFIWWMTQDARLSPQLYDVLNNPENKVFLSIVSVWEIIIKKNIKKLTLSVDLEQGIKASGFELLPIGLKHILPLETLPLYHKDPFDRLLIAQAMVENMTVITNDKLMKKYNIKVIF